MSDMKHGANRIMTKIYQPQGVTSLLVVIALSLVFIVMITGVTILSINEQRQASNTDLSNRALQAAQAAVRDAAQRLVANPLEEYPKCDGSGAVNYPSGTNVMKDLIQPTLDISTDNQVSIVCRTVTRTADALEAPINQDNNFQVEAFRPSGAAPTQLAVLWDEGTSGIAKYQPSTYYVASAGYKNAAALELSIIYWKRTDNAGTISSGNPAQIFSALILPGLKDKSFQQPRPLIDSSCNSTVVIGTGKYNCQLTGASVNVGGRSIGAVDLNSIVGGNADQYNIVVKIEPRYKDTDVYVQLFANGSPVKVLSDEAVIDVTAKVGNIYRRVSATKPVGSSSAVDSVLYTGGKICKTLQVDENHNPVPGGNGQNNCGGSE